MNNQERERFDFLRQGPCVPHHYVRDYYGLPWPLPDELAKDFGAWQAQLKKRADCGEHGISRFELETFMRQKGVVPKKWMAARLGMQEASLNELLANLTGIGMCLQRYVVYPDLIAESLPDDLVRNLPGLMFRTFSNHDSFCQRLHAGIQKTLGIEVKSLPCATSAQMKDDPLLFANTFDCITLEPLSGKHQVWLDFRKPLYLGPDRCSKLFYVKNREALRDYCAGTYEPDDLEVYSRFLAEHANG